MKDPTIATVDDEPWNQSPAELRKKALAERRRVFAETAPILKDPPPRIESALSIGERIMRRIPIMTPDGHAQFVYDLSGHTTEPRTCHCGECSILALWTELEYAPKDPTAKKYRRDYRVVRDVELCLSCTSKLKALPLGQRWNPG